jgi:hypothetical protein
VASPVLLLSDLVSSRSDLEMDCGSYGVIAIGVYGLHQKNGNTSFSLLLATTRLSKSFVERQDGMVGWIVKRTHPIR